MDVEQRARELMRSEYMLSLSGAGPKQRHMYECAIRAIIVALTPPEGDMGNPTSVPDGFVLVPLVPTHKMLEAAHAPKGYTMDGYANLHDTSDKYAAMLAARPEVADGRG